MPNDLFTLVTNVGLSKQAAANATGIKAPAFVKMVFGSGNRVPTGVETELQTLEYETDIIAQGQLPESDSTAWFDAEIPPSVGGFNIQEWGLIDEDGDLIVIGHYNIPRPKPVVANGGTEILKVRQTVVWSSLQHLNLSLLPPPEFGVLPFATDPEFADRTTRGRIAEVAQVHALMDARIEIAINHTNTRETAIRNDIPNVPTPPNLEPYATRDHVQARETAIRNDFPTVPAAPDLSVYAEKSRNITAGHGLSGGGDLENDLELELDFGELQSITSLLNDASVIINNIAGAGNKPVKIPLANFRNIIIDSLLDRKINSGLGLSGGGSLSADRTLNLVFNELPARTSLADGEYVIINSATGNGNDPAKMTLTNLRKEVTGIGANDVGWQGLRFIRYNHLVGTNTSGNDIFYGENYLANGSPFVRVSRSLPNLPQATGTWAILYLATLIPQQVIHRPPHTQFGGTFIPAVVEKIAN